MAEITYSVNEAISRLKTSRKTIYELINRKALRTYTVGNRRYVSEQAILDFIEERELAELERHANDSGAQILDATRKIG